MPGDLPDAIRFALEDFPFGRRDFERRCCAFDPITTDAADFLRHAANQL